MIGNEIADLTKQREPMLRWLLFLAFCFHNRALWHGAKQKPTLFLPKTPSAYGMAVKKNGHGQEKRNGHHPFRGHGTGRARPVADFAEAAEDEDQAEQNSPEQREPGFNSGVPVCPFLSQFVADYFDFESNITNTSW